MSGAKMKVPFVDLKAQYISIKNEIDAVVGAVIGETAFIGGHHVTAFEEAFARYCGANHCVGVANGTDAIFIALKALGVGPGDEVITAANSFIATSEAVTMAGARVVFVDCDPLTQNIDVSRIESKITPRTKVILPVHLYGQPADMAPITALAKKHNLYVVGDAAQAHGAQYLGKPIASYADITCFSFYPGKNLGAYGDAGALVTDDSTLAAQARKFGNHGGLRKYEHECEGVNSRLDGLQAAVLTVKLGHLDTWTEKRRQNAYLYNDALKTLGVRTPHELDDVRAVYHLYVIRVPSAQRDRLRDHLEAAGIATGIHYPTALPYLPAYRHLGHAAGEFPHAVAAAAEMLSLPMFAELTEAQIRYVATAVAEAGLRPPALSSGQLTGAGVTGGAA